MVEGKSPEPFGRHVQSSLNKKKRKKGGGEGGEGETWSSFLRRNLLTKNEGGKKKKKIMRPTTPGPAGEAVGLIPNGSVLSVRKEKKRGRGGEKKKNLSRRTPLTFLGERHLAEGGGKGKKKEDRPLRAGASNPDAVTLSTVTTTVQPFRRRSGGKKRGEGGERRKKRKRCRGPHFSAVTA